MTFKQIDTIQNFGFDTRLYGGSNAVGVSLGANPDDYIVFNASRVSGGNGTVMRIFISGSQVGAF